MPHGVQHRGASLFSITLRSRTLTGYELIERDPPAFLSANFVETEGMFRGWPIGTQAPSFP
jgi:hypothetical protein